jgi:hypothetical protein
VQSRAVTTLLRDFGRVNFPGWSPNGRLVQSTCDRDGNYELYIIELDADAPPHRFSAGADAIATAERRITPSTR